MARFSIKSVTQLEDNTDVYLTEPVTVAELKTYLQLEGTAYDGPLAIFITAARQMIEQYLNLSLVNKSLRVSIQNPNYKPFPLPFPPIGTISEVVWQKCRSTKVVLDADVEWFIVDSEATDQWIDSTKTGLFFISYLTVADDREVFKQAIKSQAGYMFNNRDSERTETMSPETRALIAPFKNNYF